jgi:apolipoprotein N-acyltransferase
MPANTPVANEGVDTERLLHDYAVEAEKLAARGAQVIVLPEKLGVVVDPSTRDTDAIFQPLADKTGATIIVGVVYVSSSAKYNQARIYVPGTAVQSYDKHHMLPPFESNLKPGTTLTLLPKPSQTWGVAICKDMDFTPLSRRNGNAGVGLLLVPAWDFNIDRWWHGHIAVMRGVEDGFSIARAAKNGYLTVSDYRGRILAETRSDSAPFASLIAEVPAEHHRTLYLLMGDWFAWLACGILALTLIRLYQLRRQAR